LSGPSIGREDCDGSGRVASSEHGSSRAFDDYLRLQGLDFGAAGIGVVVSTAMPSCGPTLCEASRSRDGSIVNHGYCFFELQVLRHSVSSGKRQRQKDSQAV